MRSNKFGRRLKKRSGWKHPHDINRNRRRCARRRRSANVRARNTLQGIRAQETLVELLEGRLSVAVVPPCRSMRGGPERHGPERRPTTRLEPRRPW
jgi:hypothetical protein